ncbi:1,2-phenylacetyl-CoA epoxidase subunit PaaE [Hydrogenophilus thiooxidans]|uniref:1,2-phenylacetyl-CoA epoxidase subunit PaaE n=1 Tax=Hydrogenophilus thiooxidans TaxID=2820326 RepID=UPI001C213EFB|nr:1,2-phenylacetyl-CoA epoxidase subunit PaaE [Hydrogenophilus thiooxidans]
MESFVPLTVKQIERLAPDAVAVEFDVPEPLRSAFAFTAGQHLILRHTFDGEEVRRSYSLASTPGSGRWIVGIRKIPNGRFSTWANQQLAPGMTIEALPPQGRFQFRPQPNAQRHLVAFAAGSGITPILSIVATALAEEPMSRVTLCYGNRTRTSAMFLETIEDLKNRYPDRFLFLPLFSREPQEVPLFEGRLDEAKTRTLLSALFPEPDAIDCVYLCGPNAMIDGVEAALLAHGVAQDRIHHERFGAPESAPPPHAEAHDAAAATIRVIMDGITREFPYPGGATPILDAALAAGIALPYSCKNGVCCACRAKVVAGRVRMDKNYSLEREDLEAGFVLTCQAHPLTEQVALSFDER